MGLFDPIKKLFKREEDIDLGEDNLTFPESPTQSFQQSSQGFQAQGFQQPSFQQTQMNLPSIPEQTPPPAMFNPPIQQTAQPQDVLAERIKVLENKIDVLNAKLDQIIQRLNLLESYLRYR